MQWPRLMQLSWPTPWAMAKAKAVDKRHFHVNGLVRGLLRGPKPRPRQLAFAKAMTAAYRMAMGIALNP